MNKPNGVGLVTTPLSVINTQKMAESPKDVIILTMEGQLRGGKGTDAMLLGGFEEQIYEGRFKLIIAHPESWATELGQRILTNLRRRGMNILLAVDEVHKIMLSHWIEFRPEMADMTRRLRAFLVKGSPTVCLTASIRNEEIEAINEAMGYREPAVLLASSPLQSQFKVVVLKSPASSTPADGYTDQKGIFHPGFLNLFRRIYGDELVEMVRQGRQAEIKRLIMFFRTDSQLITVFEFLREELGVRNARTAPFVMFTSSTMGQTALVIAARAGEVPTILTTQALEMGMNVPKKDVVIFSRPPDTGHSVIQGIGRTGRPLPDHPGYRRKALVYLLYNLYDLNSAKEMDQVVKRICLERDLCLKIILADYFAGDASAIRRIPGWCCSVCDTKDKINQL